MIGRSLQHSSRSAERRMKIKQMIEVCGMTVADVANEIGISTVAVYRHMKIAGVKPPHPRLNIETVKDLVLNKGLTHTEVGKLFGVSKTAVSSMMRRHGCAAIPEPKAFTGEISVEEIRERINYNPETGEMTWKKRLSARIKAGDPCGVVSRSTGYRVVRMRHANMPAHRIAWVHFHGEFPPVGTVIDHINRDRTDNRIANLRLATTAQNLTNSRRRKDNKSGVKGVWRNRNKWTTQISIDGKRHHVGNFDSKEEAAKAYAEAAKRHYGEFANPECAEPMNKDLGQ